jgi:hypothetical protein
MEFYFVAQKRFLVNAKFDPEGTSRGNNTPELIIGLKILIHECLIRPRLNTFSKSLIRAPQRRKKAICMSFTLKLPQKLRLDFTFKA